MQNTVQKSTFSVCVNMMETTDWEFGRVRESSVQGGVAGSDTAHAWS